MSKVRTPPKVNVPPVVIATALLLDTVILPTVAVAKVSVELAVKTALFPLVQPVPPVAFGDPMFQ